MFKPVSVRSPKLKKQMRKSWTKKRNLLLKNTAKNTDIFDEQKYSTQINNFDIVANSAFGACFDL